MERNILKLCTFLLAAMQAISVNCQYLLALVIQSAFLMRRPKNENNVEI
jgi:hypothetical protein